MSTRNPANVCVVKIPNRVNSRDANFPDAEIVRSEERGGLGPRLGAGAAPLRGTRGNMSLYI